ncbi:MAG: ABC transporter substrate-binding protein [Acidimicrobiales bacterium]
MINPISRRARSAALALVLGLGACSDSGDETSAEDTTADSTESGTTGSEIEEIRESDPESSDTTAASDDATSVTYPMTLESPFGETELEAKPERVAVMSSIDLDIALALGVVPVISPSYGGDPEAWSLERLEQLGETELVTFDATDGVDYEAIAAAEPDVILATSGWSLSEDYEQLSKIAPIVSFQGEDGLASMTWAERTEEASEALDLVDEGQVVIDDVSEQFAVARDAHPEFDGKTFTYAVVHPEQVTYISYAGSNIDFFTNLGFELPEAAAEFTDTNSAVSRENLDVLDADVLLVGYPFGDEGLMTQAELEEDPVFTLIPAVADGRYAVVDNAIASPLAYPSPLAEPWLIEELVPVLADATAGS